MKVQTTRWNETRIDLLPEEQSRIKEILNELKDIYCADGVCIHMDTTIATKTDVHIDILGAVNPGKMGPFQHM